MTKISISYALLDNCERNSDVSQVIAVFAGSTKNFVPPEGYCVDCFKKIGTVTLEEYKLFKLITSENKVADATIDRHYEFNCLGDEFLSWDDQTSEGIYDQDDISVSLEEALKKIGEKSPVVYTLYSKDS